jgi:AraC family transcriptional regulator
MRRMPRNSIIAKIGLVIDHVERNAGRRLTLDELSDLAGVSKFYLNRVFKALTDRQLMDYVRNRSLSRSVFDLLGTGRRVIDIALEYGFAYEQSYIRSFKRAFGVSPEAFRRKPSEVRITDRLDVDLLEPVGSDGIILEPAIIIRPSFSIVGESRELSVAEDAVLHLANALGNDFYLNKRGFILNAVAGGAYIGFIRSLPGDGDRVLYMPAAEIDGPGQVPPGMTLVEIPTLKYAVFKYIAFHHPRYVNANEYGHVYGFIYGAWFRKSQYRPEGDFRFENIRLDVAREDYCEVELYIPIADT